MRRPSGLITGLVGLGLATGLAGCCTQYSFSDEEIMQQVENGEDYLGGIEGLGAPGCGVSRLTERLGEELGLAYRGTMGDWGSHVPYITMTERDGTDSIMIGYSSGANDSVLASKSGVDFLILIDPTYTRNLWKEKIPSNVEKVLCIRNTKDWGDLCRGKAITKNDLENPNFTKYENVRINLGHLDMPFSEEVYKIIRNEIKEFLSER